MPTTYEVEGYFVDVRRRTWVRLDNGLHVEKTSCNLSSYGKNGVCFEEQRPVLREGRAVAAESRPVASTSAQALVAHEDVKRKVDVRVTRKLNAKRVGCGHVIV